MCLTHSASGAVEMVTAEYGALNMGQSASVSVPQFDPSLGTLTGIMVELDSEETVQSHVINFTSISGSYKGAAASLPVRLLGPNGLSISTLVSTVPASGNVASKSLITASSQVETVSSQVLVQPSDFALYVGDGDQSFNINVLLGSCVGTYTGTQLAFGGSGAASGKVVVSYSYASVPEPGTLCAGFAAVGMVGLALRKR